MLKKKLFRNRKGQALVEYALIIAGVTLVAAAGVTIFGHKVAGMFDVAAVILPGAHDDCNNPIADGQLIETTTDANGNIVVDAATIAADKGTVARLTQNLFGDGASGEALAPNTAAAGKGNGGG